MTDRELLELIASQVSKLTSEVDEIKSTMATKDELAGFKEIMATKQDLAEVKTIVVKIENEQGQKHNALFDGYKLHSEKLNRIEAEVSKHDEIILKRIR